MAGTGLATQVTRGEEGAYGTIAADITRAIEIRSEGLEDAIERIESESLRAGKRLQQHWRPNRKGAEGDLEHEVLDKGFGIEFKHALGTLAAPAHPVVGADVGVLAWDHVATLGNLNGKSRTFQIGRAAVDGIVHPFTLLGAKVADFELGVEVDGMVLYTQTLDFQDVRTPSSPVPGPALAVPSYPAAAVPLDFIGARIQVGGADVDVSSFTFSGSNNLKTDRYFLRRSSLKKEPLEETEVRDLTVELGGEFEGLTAYNRFVNGTEATMLASFRGDVIETIGATTFYAQLDVAFARLRWDGGTPTAGGADVLEQPQECKVLQPFAGEAVTLTYRTTDPTA